jgi:hypothetical protein
MISWNDFIDTLKGEVQDKSKNPFFGAFIATWLIRHWEVVFIILNFDDDFDLDIKLERVNNYLSSRPAGDFWITIGLTFLVIFLGYVFLNLARIISNISEKLVTPIIYKWTAGKASIVTKETYDQALKWEKNAKDRLEQQIDENSKLRKEIEDWEKRYDLLRNDENNYEEELEEKSSFRELPSVENNVNKTKVLKDLDKLYEKVKYDDFKKHFIKNASKIKAKIPLDRYDSDILKTLKYDLIKVTQVEENSTEAFFELTELGEELLNKFNYDDDFTI